MIKLTDILNELSINNPVITPEKAEKYYWDNIEENNDKFKVSDKGWKEYKGLCQPYMEKYELKYTLSDIEEFEKLSKSELNRFYNEMRKLVHKHVGKEIL